MIIGITGSIAAGKETLTSFLRDKGFIYLESSSLLKEELERRGTEITRTNMQNLGDEWRAEFGPAALMKKFLEIIDPEKDYIIDSLRNPGEAEFMRKTVPGFIFIGVDAPREIRFKRIISRGKPHDPKNWEEFLVVDERDLCDKTNPLGQQVGKCLEIVDFKVINAGRLEDSKKEIQEIWEKIKLK
jgi:dephospho-CoA kinase